MISCLNDGSTYPKTRKKKQAKELEKP